MERLDKIGVSIKCGVDARQLASHYGGAQFDRIVFNLPQSPPQAKARNQIQRHRALLRDFCGSAAAALAPRGELWITLLAGQGGTPLDPISRSPGDTWQLQQEAACAGLLVEAVEQVDLDALEAAGYAPTGRRKEGLHLGERRKAKGLVTHILQRERPEAGAEAPRGIAPLEWSLDNSFWLDGAAAEAPPSPGELLELSRHHLGTHAAHALPLPPLLIDSYARPTDGRHARTYRFTYRSEVLALSRDRAIRLNAAVCDALAERYEFEPRNPAAPKTHPKTHPKTAGEEGADAAGAGDDTQPSDHASDGRGTEPPAAKVPKTCDPPAAGSAERPEA